MSYICWFTIWCTFTADIDSTLNRIQARWVTVRGQIIWPKNREIPRPKPIDVKNRIVLANGPLLSDQLLVNPKSRGIKNTWIYIRPREGDTFSEQQIHPRLSKYQPKEIVIDQPNCQFVPRIFAGREGDTLRIKNSSNLPHSTKYNSMKLAFLAPLPAGGAVKLSTPLDSHRAAPHLYSCLLFPWMEGRGMVFDHPYYALTDEDGYFEIRWLPRENLRIFYRHELGFHKGRAGNKGYPLEMKGENPIIDLPTVEFEFPE